MKMYIKPIVMVVQIDCDELLNSSQWTVDFTFSTEVDDDWQDNEDMWLE